MDRVGFIGLGSMGGALADRFLAAGWNLMVYDTNLSIRSAFEARGALPAQSAREIADHCDVAFACLPSTQACLEVALGANGVASGKALRVYVETSTIGLKVAGAIAAGLAPHIGFIDAPISGGPPGARSGTLTTMVSGERP